ncbi:MAG: carboxypeptidase regulatory-like domain-containing protein [Bacteroidia bacterium]|nr:carboxypeptidase regulatory-like domain-containing protein [Bacteroidia bacterium]
MSQFFTQKVLAFLALIILPLTMWAQGVTTSSMNGRVADQEGGMMVGATIIANHTPSGTKYGSISNEEGYYRLPNMRVGGPYTITVTYTGYETVTVEGVFLRLGENFRRDFVLAEAGVMLDEVEITSTSSTTGTNSGASTQITSTDIDVMPTLNRNVSDYVRLTPQSTGYGGGTSFGGVNNRFNAIYIDGAVNNDVFGLSSQGTNGGQTGTAPFSIDIIDQLQVVLSPYDVTLGGFAGGGINAVTKSGTNEIKGTAYYFFQNEGLVGKTNKSLTDRTGSEPTAVADFSQATYGASVGGPLVKDKVFFFVNAEAQADQTPAPFDFGVYTGNASQAQLNSLSDYLQSKYNYDPGTFGDVQDELNGLKLFAKIDININDNNRLTLRHNYTNAENINRNASTATRINFSNNGVFFPSTTNTSALELNSRFGNNLSNNLIVGYTSVNDDRDPLEADFPYVYINDGSGQVTFGSEEFSTGNALTQNIFTITDNFKIYQNAHTITIGTHNEFYSIYNLFIGQNYGTYRFNSVADFLADSAAIEYDRAYSLVDNITGDGSQAAANFNAMQLGFYAQDEWAVSPQFTLTGGIRLDIPILTTDPAIDPSFNTTTLPLIQAQYDVAKDVEGGSAPDGQLMISPRVGFIYDLNGDRSNILRGGVGIFTSRIPFVWPGAMYSNNGLTLGRVDERNITGDVVFNPNIQTQYTNPDFTVPSGQIDVFTKNFKYPQVLRGNLAFDTKLGDGWGLTIEGIYTKTLNNVVYTEVNSDTTVRFNWTNTGGDDRPVYSRTAIDPTYNSIYVGSNTSEGYTYNITAALSKKFDFGLDATLSYTYGDAQAVSEGTSSQNSSQWRGQVSTDGRNNPVLGRSDFALGQRVLGVLTYSADWNKAKNATTTISLLYEGLQGSPYSYVIGGNNARNTNNETGSTSRNRSLIWIPASASEINLVETNGVSPAEQWSRLDAFIESDSYLSKNRGAYAGKNSNWLPFTSYLDLSLRQDVGIMAGGKMHKLQFSWDVFNLANLINPSWGVRYQVPGDFNNYFLYNLVGYAADGTTPQFSYTPEATGKDALNIDNFNSRWRMRLGVRYILD